MVRSPCLPVGRAKAHYISDTVGYNKFANLILFAYLREKISPQVERFHPQLNPIPFFSDLTQVDLSISHDQALAFPHSPPDNKDGTQFLIQWMELFCILEPIILHDSRALRPDPFENNGSLFRLKFLSNRFIILGVYVEDGKRLGCTDPNTDRPGSVHVFYLEDIHLL